jgi:soluble lytic murein transglycosylase-like protein
MAGVMRIVGIGLIASLFTATPVCAQVYEIGDTGDLNVRDGGGAVTWREVRAAPVNPIAEQVAISAVIAPRHYQVALENSAARYSLSPALLEALVWQESRWQSRAVSPRGAIGLAQLMPQTAKSLGVDAYDPLANLDGGARYLRLMLNRFAGDIPMALAAYNAGAARVERWRGIPPIRETQNYVASILTRLGNRSSALVPIVDKMAETGESLE